MNNSNDNPIKNKKLVAECVIPETSVINQNQLLPTKIVQLNESKLNIRYAQLGDVTKPVVILFHGVPENLQCWYAVAPLLADSYHVLAIDWPGFGGSEPLTSNKDYHPQAFADVIVDFMDSMNIPKANLVATDIGLLPALLVGLQNAHRVNRLAVMDGIPFPGEKYSSWELKSFAKKGSIRGKALVHWFPGISAKIARLKGFYRGNSIPYEVRQEFMSDGNKKTNQKALLSYFQNFHIGQEYFEPRANELKLPVKVIWGKYDRFINVKLAYEITAKLPNATLTVIDKAGHYVHMDKPQVLAQVVTEFLNEN
jgi:pimeloyl-ACP methyl ester carboxylesterase